jgi:signal transduction histidine kinase
VLEPSDVVIGEVAREAVELVRPLADARGVRLELVLPTSLREAALSVRADRRRVRQILVSLLDNAVKFTDPGGNAGVQVSAGRETDPPEVTVVVWDTGVGIADADRARIFEPFTQIPSGLARRHDGPGLGLALVGHLVALHGGRVEVDSAPGRGARFAVTLPVAGASAAFEDGANAHTRTLK